MRKLIRFSSKVAAAMVFALLIIAVPRSASGNPDLQAGGTEEGPGLFKFIRTVVVAPDANFLIGGFARVNYVPATDRLIVAFGTRLAQPTGGCKDAGHAYKEYTLDMQATGKSGVLNCEVGDSGGVMADNTYYDVSMHKQGGSIGWRIVKYDAVTWKNLADIFFPLDSPREGDGDPMVTFVNGQLDVSSGYTKAGGPPPPEKGEATHHEFFSPDLKFLGKKSLADTPHIGGSSLIYVDGIYYFITATAYTGDLIMMKYDKDWQYLGMKELRKQAHWSTGVAFDGQRFYVAYLNTSQRTEPGFFPYYPNVHLAAFDRDWNLVDDVAVTDFAPSDNKMTGRPWVSFHGNQLYVSYDVAPIDPVTHKDQLDKIEAIVSIYELTSTFPPPPTQQSVTPPAQSGQPTGQSGACGGDQVSPLGVIRSTDHGATWTSLGNACMHDLTILPADPTPVMIDGHVVLYFVDFGSLGKPVPQIIYRTTSGDGVHFDKPQPAYTQTRTMVDPFVLRMPDGSFRLYVPSDQEGTISAVSRDGLVFTRENGARTTDGGMPGALLLPDNQVRMFLAGGNEGKEGIFSKISNDGLNFTIERGLRIPAPPNSIADNPEPIRLADGTYLMLYQIHDIKYEGLPPWEHTEIHLATSVDGFNWIANPTVIGYGGTSCVVEMQDGTLLIYYGH
jgi:hypothetical protein